MGAPIAMRDCARRHSAAIGQRASNPLVRVATMRVGIIGGSGLLHSAFFSGLTTETVDTEHGAVVLRSGVFGDHGVQVLFCQVGCRQAQHALQLC